MTWLVITGAERWCVPSFEGRGEGRECLVGDHCHCVLS